MTDSHPRESLALAERKGLFLNQAETYFHESLVGTRGPHNLLMLKALR